VNDITLKWCKDPRADFLNSALPWRCVNVCEKRNSTSHKCVFQVQRVSNHVLSFVAKMKIPRASRTIQNLNTTCMIFLSHLRLRGIQCLHFISSQPGSATDAWSSVARCKAQIGGHADRDYNNFQSFMRLRDRASWATSCLTWPAQSPCIERIALIRAGEAC
jgi:hypothetical protein